MNNSFVHLEYSNSHPGVERFERVMESAGALRQGFNATRGLAGGLLAAWVLMWVIGFAAVALLAPTARSLATRVMQGLDGWSQGIARRRADERLWALASKDARVMADIQAAASRAEVELSDASVLTSPVAQVAHESAAVRVARMSRGIWNE